MQAVLFYLQLPFLYLLSVLPFPLLYLFSDFVYVLLYYVIGYRKGIVKQNLQRSFPQKTGKEIHALRKAYYHYFCDLFLETFKTLTISKKAMLRHCYMTPETIGLFDKLDAEKQSCIIVMGHFGNWEWGGNTFSLSCKQQLYVIYHPVSNKHFDSLLKNMRQRFATRLIPMKETFREMMANRHHVSATAFIADQTPPPENAYWTTFLNQDTPVFWGTERIARKLNYPVIYTSIHRIRRGYYEMRAEILCENPSAAADGEISQLHTRRLEQDIINQPEIWLWSHRRWKHRRPEK